MGRGAAHSAETDGRNVLLGSRSWTGYPPGSAQVRQEAH